MLYGQVPGIPKPISRLVQGCVRTSSKTHESDFALFDAVWELGCRAFDTAIIYGAGDSERTLGRWVRERGVRDQAVLITKGAHPTMEGPRVTPEHIRSDVGNSLRNLDTDYIDLYLLHRDDPKVPVGPIVEVLNEQARAGKILAFGGSNWSHERLAEANEYARANGLIPFAASSPNFCLMERVKEPWAGCLSISGPKGEAARKWYAESRMPVFSWSSLAAGMFSGRFRRDNLDTFTDPLDRVCIVGHCYEDNFRRLDRARELAERKGCALAQIGLAYVFSSPMDVYALNAPRSREEFAENAAALEMRLTPEEVAWLELRSDAL